MNNKNLFLLSEIVKRNFAAKYKDSKLGLLWSFIKPLLIMILLTIIFSTVFGANIENYPVYLLAGKCIYDFFSAGTTISMLSLRNNQNILKKTPAPKYIFVLGSVFSEFINYLITLLILVAVMIVTKSSFYFNTMFFSVIPIVSLLIFMVGLGLILSVFCVYYKDIEHLWGVVTMMGMYACAIFFPMNIIPEPFYSYMILNPLYWIIDQFRLLFVYGTFPNLLNIINSLLFSAIIFVLGIIIFKKYGKKVAMKF